MKDPAQAQRLLRKWMNSFERFANFELFAASIDPRIYLLRREAQQLVKETKEYLEEK